MAKQKVIIMPDSWAKVLDEISKEIGQALDLITENEDQRRAFLLYLQTSREVSDSMFNYLPSEERESIKALFGLGVNIGILYARSPGLLIDIIKRVEATGITVEEGGQDGNTELPMG